MTTLPINYNKLTKRCLDLQTEIKDLNNAILYYKRNIETYKQLYNLKQVKKYYNKK